SATVRPYAETSWSSPSTSSVTLLWSDANAPVTTTRLATTRPWAATRCRRRRPVPSGASTRAVPSAGERPTASTEGGGGCDRGGPTHGPDRSRNVTGGETSRTSRNARAERSGARPRHHAPYTATEVAASRAHTSASGSPTTSATVRTVVGSTYGALGRPRYGCGVRYGASVSTRTCPSGTARSAARSSSFARNVTGPAKDRYQPCSAQNRAIAASPE